MTPVRASDLVLWPLNSVAVGALLATYAVPGGPGAPSRANAGIGGGVLSALAIGCPICNKLVVLVLGLSGALTYFGPIQPALGALALVIALTAPAKPSAGAQRQLSRPAPALSAVGKTPKRR
ncbi:MAG: hypothetical protein ACR2G3_11350 [Solirubrobacterales bacterium]